MRAVKRFKQLIVQRRPELLEGIFGSAAGIVQPPLSLNPLRSKSDNVDARQSVEQETVAEGLRPGILASDELKKLAHETDVPSIAGLGGLTLRQKHAEIEQASEGASPHLEKDPRKKFAKGQAHDPLEDTLYLGIGTGTETPIEAGAFAVVSESPGAVDMNVYEQAYQEEVDRIIREQKQTEHSNPTLYLTRRVEHVKQLRENEHITNHLRRVNVGFHQLVEQAKQNVESATSSKTSQGGSTPAIDLKSVANQAKEKYEAAKGPPSQEDNNTSSSSFSLKKLVGSAKQKLEAATSKSSKTDAK